MDSLGRILLSICFTWYFWSVAFGAKGKCCEYVLVSARGPVASVQGAALGQYFWNGTDASSGKEFYKKYGKKGRDYFLYYDSGPKGWSIGLDMSGRKYFVTTRNGGECPHAGVARGYDRNKYLDDTFAITCADQGEKPDVECCDAVVVSASDEGEIGRKQGRRLGVYEEIGVHDGQPAYKLRNGANHLFFRRTGRSRNDGWTIATELGSDRVAITTRDTGTCPNGIAVGYNLNRATDNSFRIACEGEGSLPQGDDGDETTLIEDDDEADNPYSAGVASQDDVIFDGGYRPDPPRPYIPAIFDVPVPRDPRDSYTGGGMSCRQCLCGECGGGGNGNIVSGAGTGYLQPRGGK